MKYNEEDLQEAFELGYKNASISSKKYNQKDLQAAFNKGYKESSITLAGLSALIPKAVGTQVARNIASNLALKHTPFVHNTLSDYFSAGVKNKYPSKLTQFKTKAVSALAPGVSDVADMVRDTGKNLHLYLKENKLTPEPAHFEYIKAVVGMDTDKMKHYQKNFPQHVQDIHTVLKKTTKGVFEKPVDIVNSPSEIQDRLKSLKDAYGNTAMSKYLPKAFTFNPNVGTSTSSLTGSVGEVLGKAALSAFEPISVSLASGKVLAKRFLSHPKIENLPPVRATKDLMDRTFFTAPLKASQRRARPGSYNLNPATNVVRNSLLGPVGEGIGVARLAGAFQKETRLPSSTSSGSVSPLY